MGGLSTGSFALTATASGYIATSTPVSAGTTRIDSVLQRLAGPAPAPTFAPSPTPTPAPAPFSFSGTGANVFTIPSSVSRIRITGSNSGSGENFIVYIDNRLIVNEILGTCSVASGSSTSTLDVRAGP
jgi:hypothetical protein